MKVFYDWEFQENGTTIVPISVGMVREDGAELYLVNGEYPIDDYLKPDPVNTWLRENVLPFMPILPMSDGTLMWDEDHPDFDSVWNLDVIRGRVQRFLLGPGEEVELWAWYGAYDHVCLARLWGIMANLPAGVPMYTNDLRQLAHMLGVKPDSRHDDKHHALYDALWNRDTYMDLMAYMQLNAGPQRLAAGARDGMADAG